MAQKDKWMFKRIKRRKGTYATTTITTLTTNTTWDNTHSEKFFHYDILACESIGLQIILEFSFLDICPLMLLLACFLKYL